MVRITSGQALIISVGLVVLWLAMFLMFYDILADTVLLVGGLYILWSAHNVTKWTFIGLFTCLLIASYLFLSYLVDPVILTVVLVPIVLVLMLVLFAHYFTAPQQVGLAAILAVVLACSMMQSSTATPALPGVAAESIGSTVTGGLPSVNLGEHWDVAMARLGGEDVPETVSLLGGTPNWCSLPAASGDGAWSAYCNGQTSAMPVSPPSPRTYWSGSECSTVVTFFGAARCHEYAVVEARVEGVPASVDCPIMHQCEPKSGALALDVRATFVDTNAKQLPGDSVVVMVQSGAWSGQAWTWSTVGSVALVKGLVTGDVWHYGLDASNSTFTASVGQTYRIVFPSLDSRYADGTFILGVPDNMGTSHDGCGDWGCEHGWFAGLHAFECAELHTKCARVAPIGSAW